MFLSQIEDVGFCKDALNCRLAPRPPLHGRWDTRGGEGLGDLMNGILTLQSNRDNRDNRDDLYDTSVGCHGCLYHGRSSAML